MNPTELRKTLEEVMKDEHISLFRKIAHSVGVNLDLIDNKGIEDSKELYISAAEKIAEVEKVEDKLEEFDDRLPEKKWAQGLINSCSMAMRIGHAGGSLEDIKKKGEEALKEEERKDNMYF